LNTVTPYSGKAAHEPLPLATALSLLLVLSSGKRYGRLLAMELLRLPIWFVKERDRTVEAKHTPCDDPGATVAFTNTGRLTAFLRTGRSGRWDIQLASDYNELILAISDLHASGTSAVCMDPDVDGSGGEHVFINRILTEVSASGSGLGS